MEVSEREKSVCFTGHRPDQLQGIRVDDLRLELQTAIQEAIDAGYETFYCGMAMGTDILAGEITVSLREQYPWVKLIAVVPFPEQSKDWPEEWETRYRALLQKCDDAVVLLPRAKRGGYYLRNRFMVDRSQLLIGVYNGTSRGGTAYTIRYAKQQGLELRLLLPRNFRAKR